jgi:flagellar biosynthesis GTPase FlhF
MSTASAPLAETEQDTAAARVYRGRSIDELIPQIEAELGADAIVVRRRRGLEGGIGGFFQRPYIEVEAKPGTPRIDLYDEISAAPALPPALQKPAERDLRETLAPAPAVPRPVGAYVTDTLATIAAAGAPTSVVEDPPRPATEPPSEFRELTPDTFGAALAQAAHSAEQAFASPAPAPPAAAAPPLDPFAAELERIDRGMGDPPALDARRQQALAVPPPRRERARAAIERSLLDVGVGEELTRELIDAAIAHALPFAPRIGLAKAVHGALVARIPHAPLLPTPSATVAVVGPGGSGKTSCCAALLGAYRKAQTLPASCATIVLTGERQEPSMLLSPYIMEPLPVAGARARQALATAREEGLLLLDLPPLSPADRPAIRQIAALLGHLRVDRVVVALPATLGAKAASQLLEALRPLGAKALAITHADETDQLGVAVEAACRFDLAPEYLLDRGRVRGGLTRIDPTHLADRLLP